MPTATLDAFVLHPEQWLLLGVAGERHHDTISDIAAALLATRASWEQVLDLEARGLIMPVDLDELPKRQPQPEMRYMLMLTSAGKHLYLHRIRPYRAGLQLAGRTNQGITVKDVRMWCGIPRLHELERAECIQVVLADRDVALEDVVANHQRTARITLRPKGRRYLADTKGA
jgi:DNA-binding MarR family transcriptional regulator